MKTLPIIVSGVDLARPTPSDAQYRREAERCAQRVQAALPLIQPDGDFSGPALAECLQALKLMHVLLVVPVEDEEALKGTHDAARQLTADLAAVVSQSYPGGVELRRDDDNKMLPRDKSFVDLFATLRGMSSKLENFMMKVQEQPPGQLREIFEDNDVLLRDYEAGVRAHFDASRKHPETAILLDSLAFRLAFIRKVEQQAAEGRFN